MFSVERRISRISLLLLREEKKLRLLSSLRLLAFGAFLIWIFAAYIIRVSSEIYYLPSLFFLWAFYRLLAVYQARRDKSKRLEVWRGLVERQKARLSLNADGYPKLKREIYREISMERDLPSWTKDLDFLGEKGIFARIDTTSTLAGYSKFLGYFLDPDLTSAVRERQGSVSALSGRSAVLQKILRHFGLYEASIPTEKEIKEEALPSYIPSILRYDKNRQVPEEVSPPAGLFKEEPKEFWKRALAYQGRWIRFIFPFWIAFVWVAVLVGLFLGKTWGFGFFLLNLGLFGIYRNISLELISPLAQQAETLPELGKLLRYVLRSKVVGTSGKELLKNWTDAEFIRCWKELRKIADRASYSQAPLPHSVLNFLFLFDLWFWKRYDKWWEEWGKKIIPAFEELCELDSLLPLANLRWIEPTFTFPTILKESDGKKIEAKDLVHPLIHAEKRIPNNLEPVAPGDLLLLTGSNMSGKTTYLRSVGICGILSMAGGPVPASYFSTPLLKVHSSIRNEDSVDEGISFFYAEVRRLAKILTEVSDSKSEHLVLLDEILKGTNSRERTLACKGILKSLKSSRVFGIVTTHDLELASLDGLVLRHFREEIKDGKMSFDYRIRPGIVQSSNALEVLKLEGLDLDFN
ncbi:MutS domain V protein [Leptospira broomii serovar Hurstbridge str. 5399]|uniref:MutS domain V protein n=2 Tax=Leptospira broomii TaxID=301541 RepID=T0FDU9_9LEPT|nr:MutS domain V protein [Leptospira broomii serovar Hurstbridge str. 5399]